MENDDDMRYPYYQIPKRCDWATDPPGEDQQLNRLCSPYLEHLKQLIEQYRAWGLSMFPVEPKGKKPLFR